ncbi:Trm112 family protein [Desulfohalobiaceae bacterium Ax17]|uniref:Trm112 family protein n=1 Tax=Desulfovulcanus ferrireducens TaxID=2831190 RepID=UPI00207BCE62|nr:Trm112 family protein [Desulfovulcanus ferrireducens]MBT8763484.1 Trm112 family protein [Desulfovulcanus ferrireducens]
MTLNKDLLDILACPKCKGDLILTQKEDGLICETCSLVYPIKEEIPIMLIEEAIKLDEWKKKAQQ